jgi:hypothetical protein
VHPRQTRSQRDSSECRRRAWRAGANGPPTPCRSPSATHSWCELTDQAHGANLDLGASLILHLGRGTQLAPIDQRCAAS